MGISAPLVHMHCEWAAEGLLRPHTSVLDIGTQELFCDSEPEALNRFVCELGGERYTEAETKALAHNGLVGDLFRRAGFSYLSIDIVPGPHALRMDLNADALPRKYRRRFHWVANHGTSEHILNQWNVFKTMHDACAVGGFMYHNVPMCEPFHGVVSYSPKFFQALCRANGYRVVKAWAWTADDETDVAAEIGVDVPFNRPTAITRLMWINYMFQKVHDAPFRGLADCIP